MTANIPLSLASDRRLVASDKEHSVFVALFPILSLSLFQFLFFLSFFSFVFLSRDERYFPRR